MVTKHKPRAGDKSVGAGEFKARCLALLDEVGATRHPILITKRGKPVARLVPVEGDMDVSKKMRGSVVWCGDIVSPTGVEWTVDKDNHNK